MVIIQKRKEKKEEALWRVIEGEARRQLHNAEACKQITENQKKQPMKSKNLHLNQGGSDPEASQQGQVLLNTLTLKCIKEQ